MVPPARAAAVAGLVAAAKVRTQSGAIEGIVPGAAGRNAVFSCVLPRVIDTWEAASIRRRRCRACPALAPTQAACTLLTRARACRRPQPPSPLPWPWRRRWLPCPWLRPWTRPRPPAPAARCCKRGLMTLNSKHSAGSAPPAARAPAVTFSPAPVAPALHTHQRRMRSRTHLASPLLRALPRLGVPNPHIHGHRPRAQMGRVTTATASAGALLVRSCPFFFPPACLQSRHVHVACAELPAAHVTPLNSARAAVMHAPAARWSACAPCQRPDGRGGCNVNAMLPLQPQSGGQG